MRVEQQIEYEVQSDAEAIQVARDRLGRDAVILSSRHVKLGGFLGFFKRSAILVTAGILVADKEDTVKESRERMVAFQHLLDVRRAVAEGMPPEKKTRKQSDESQADTVSSSAFSLQQHTPTVSAAAAYEANSTRKNHQDIPPLAKDVDEIKGILAKVLERLDGNSEVFGSTPLRNDENLKMLIRSDVESDIADDIVTEFKDSSADISFSEWLAQKIPTMGSSFSVALGGKRVLFAGPTGVGKTTTIAKIAATQSLWENKKVVLMTADTYRIAAVEQLRTYAKILGIPIEITAEPKDIQVALKKHKDADLILLDTAGRSHYDGTRIEELHALYDAFMPESVHLVLAANTKYRDMLNVIERMSVVPISALIFTKLDETSSYGTILNVLRDFDLPVSFFTIGQNVPNDIEIASGDRFVDFLMEKNSARRVTER